MPQYRKRKRAASILDPFKPVIDGFLGQDHYQATWIFERIGKMGYQGSYDTVKNYVHKVKDRLMRIYYDQDLLATYTVPEGRDQVVANPLFYEQVKRDKALLLRKYEKAKGKAARRPPHASPLPQVQYRPLSVYEQLVQGGA